MSCSIAEENVFGPSVAPTCLNGFDFTLLFEETVLTIAPIVVTCLISPIRVWKLRNVPIVVNRSWLYFAKLLALSTYTILQLVLLILWGNGQAPTTSATIPSTVLSVTAFLFFLYVSHVEHLRSLRPSTILNIYLGTSLLLDIARARTLWSVIGGGAAAGCFSAACAVKAFVLVCEATEKRSLLKDRGKVSAVEATSGIYNRSVFWWLNSLLWKGCKTLLTLDMLTTLDSTLTAASNSESLVRRWNKVEVFEPLALLWTFLVHYKWRVLAGVIPRLACTGFTFAQPFLVKRVLDFMDEPEHVNSDNKAYGLIGAYAIVYIGTAISYAMYENKTDRLITMFRGSLVSMIFDKTLRIQESSASEAAAVTLMSTDVERIGSGMRELHEVYASIIELGLSLWLLERLLHVAMAGSTIFVVFCLIGGIPLAVVAGNAQGKWLNAIEKRISVTSQGLGAIKGVKMTGLTTSLSSSIEGLRAREIRKSRPFRLFDVLVIVVSYASSALAPAFGFGCFILLARAHGTTTLTNSVAFSALTLFSLLEKPMLSLIHGGEELMTVVNCFGRIQKFLLQDERVDYRLTADNGQLEDSLSLSTKKSATASGPALDNEKLKTAANCAVLRHVSAGYSNEKSLVLNGLSLNIPRQSITTVVGPVGCGKTTFLKLLLGEIPHASGSVHTSFTQAAYCSQTPWASFGTIKENIVDASPWDRPWYEHVLHACALNVDLQELPGGDQTKVGSGGSRLSGGQQKRIALARALFSRQEVLILDDVLTGLDQTTENHILQSVFGSEGLLKKGGNSVILTTSSAHQLPCVDNIFVLDSSGRLVEQEPDELAINSGYSNKFGYRTQAPGATRELDIVDVDILQDLQLNEEHLQDTSRQTGDLTVYRYYFQNVGWVLSIFFLTCSCAFVFSLNFPQIWLQWWTDANEKQPNGCVGYWLGIYAGLGLLNLALAALCDWLFMMVILPKTAKRFHDILLHTTMKSASICCCLVTPFGLSAYRASAAFLTSTDIGITINRFSQDLALIDMELPSSFDLTVTAFLSCIAEGILVFIGASSYVALAIPGCILVMYLLQKYYLRTSRQIRLLDIEAKAPLYSQFLQVLSGLTSIRAQGWTDEYQRRIRMALNTSQRPYYLLFCIQRWLNLVLDLMVAGIAVLVVSIATTLRGKASTNFLGVALFNIVNFSSSLQQLIAEWTKLETAIGAVSRVRSYVQETEPEDLHDETGPVADDWPCEGNIIFDSVSASYGTISNESVLQGITLEIQPGEKIAICGRTGSGKSSFISTILRMLEIRCGTILVDGVDISKIPRETVRARLNTIPQEPFFLHGNVRYNLDPTNECNDLVLIESLETVGLWEYIDSIGGLDVKFTDDLLSHGQRQLFCLARAICRPGSIALMDEISSSVDSKTEQTMQEIIRSKFQSRTVICVTHKLQSIMDFDKVAMVDKGRVVEFGSPSALVGRAGSALRALVQSTRNVSD